MTGRPRSLVPLAHIKAWERELAAILKEEKKLSMRRETFQRLIESAKAANITVDQKDLLKKAPKQRRAPTPRRITAVRKKRLVVPAPEPQRAKSMTAGKRPERSEWKGIIREIALTSTAPVPYAEAKAEIMKTPLAERLRQSDKGFYGAIAKLQIAKEIVSYKGHIFTPELFAKFKTDLDAGRVRDLKIPNTAHHSPMGEAITKMMRSRPNGAESGHIIWELRKNPEFAAVIAKNKTHPYNVLARMVRTDELAKRGKRYFYPDAETPPVQSGGVSNLFGEGGASPHNDRGAA